MKKSKLKKNSRHHIDKRQLCAISIIAVMAVLTIYLAVNTRITGLGINDRNYKTINNGFTITYNEITEEVTLPANVKETTYDVVITKHFEKSELIGNDLCFYAYNPECSIYINDKLVLNDAVSGDVLNLAAPSHWYFIEIPEEDFDITINMHNDLKVSTIFEMYNGDKASLVFFIFEKNIITLIMSFIITIAGISMVIASLFINGKLGVRLGWLGIVSVDSGIWVYSLAKASQLFIERASVTAFLGYCTFFMLPVLVSGFLLTYEAFNKKLYMRLVFWVQFTITAAILILQLLHIVQWVSLLWVVHIEVFSILACVIAEYIRSVKEGQKHETGIYYALIVIGTLICVDIIRYYIAKPSDGVIKYSTYGLLVLLGYLAYSVIHMITVSSMQETKNAIYRELAFKDAMTQLDNRSSYELKVEELRQNEEQGGMVLIADLNNLKLINDTYGHHYGDDAIIRTATLLRRFFSDIAQCYRTGGDEFCIISENISEKEFMTQYILFMEAVKEEGTFTKYPYSVATGYGMATGRDIDGCIMKVDADMYKNKRDSKKGRSE